MGIQLAEYQDWSSRQLRNSRIAVVGAGASGLSTAQALRAAGYERVTVFEREETVGGKCHTIWHEGRSYDLGAVALTRAWKTVRRHMREVGVGAVSRSGPQRVDLDAGKWSLAPQPLHPSTWLRLGPEGIRIAILLARHRRIFRPGFEGVDPDLHRPFGEWARRHRVEKIADLIEPAFVALGYGFCDEIPAAYVLKIATKVGQRLELVDEGFGGLWARVAQGLDVRLGVEIERVERSEQGVKIRTDSGEFDVDALIVTCPLDQALEFLDASEGEGKLIAPIRYNSYFVVGAIVEGLSRAHYGTIPKHLTRDHIGEPIGFYRRHQDSNLILFYSYGRDLGDERQVVDGVRSAVDRLGGRLLEVHTVKPWAYFPHVLQRDLDNCYYRKLEGLQGERRTWYAGEIFAFSDVESTAAYGQHLVDRFFQSPQGSRS